MKPKEVPEKLYVNSNDHLTYNGYYAFTNKMRACDIEYTRTDAFIEKACEWLENNLQGIVGGSIYIEDFRKYMKGE